MDGADRPLLNFHESIMGRPCRCCTVGDLGLLAIIGIRRFDKGRCLRVNGLPQRRRLIDYSIYNEPYDWLEAELKCGMR